MIDKGLFGLNSLNNNEEGSLDDEGTTVEFELESEQEVDLKAPVEFDNPKPDKFNINLAEKLDEGELSSLSNDLLSLIEEDDNSRKDHQQMYIDGLELLGMKLDERNDPWPGACGIFHPLMTEALVKFQAETMMETFPASGPVKTEIIGKETPDKKAAAVRVQSDMNHQLIDVMSEYRPEHERMLWGLGLAGNAFKKVYYDPILGRQSSIYVPEEDMIVPYGATSLATSERVTQVMRKSEAEVMRMQFSKFYRDVDLPEPYMDRDDEVKMKISEQQGFTPTRDEQYCIYECHCNIDLPGFEDKSGLPLPYIVTIEKESGTILAIRRNWNPKDKRKLKRAYFVHYPYIPGFGFYAFGLIHLVGGFAKSSTSIIRQLIDAGTLANLPAGFKTRGMKGKNDDSPMKPGEWRDVDVLSTSLKDSMLPLPYKEPSGVLFELLKTIVDEARRFASVADTKISDMSSQTPVGTTLAVLERTLKVMTSIQARIHYSMKEELRLLRDIIRDYTPDDYEYDPEEGDRKAKKADYNLVDVIPVSDPNSATMAQKIAQYQAVYQLAQGAPQVYNMPLLHRQMLEVLGVKNASKLIHIPEDAIPLDPVTENMMAINNKPLKAFMQQDHAAHITVHMNLMNDPTFQQQLQQLSQANPNINATFSSAISAHIMEHLAFQHRQSLQEMMPMELPNINLESPEENNPTAGLDPQAEAQLAQAAAQAADEVLNRNKTSIAAQQAQQAASDPLVQMQQQELQISQAEQQRKVNKDSQDYDIEMKRLAIQDKEITARFELEGFKLGLNVAKTKEEMMKDNSEFELKKHDDTMQLERDKHQEKVKLEREKSRSKNKLDARKQQSKDKFDNIKHQNNLDFEREKHLSSMNEAQVDRDMRYDMEMQKLTAQVSRDAQNAQLQMMSTKMPDMSQQQGQAPGQQAGQPQQPEQGMSPEGQEAPPEGMPPEMMPQDGGGQEMPPEQAMQ